MMDSESNSFLQEKLWHLLALLLLIGYPVDAKSLSSRCSFFNASPDFVRYVASLPDFPLSVNRNGLLTPSARALFALARFFYSTSPIRCPLLSGNASRFSHSLKVEEIRNDLQLVMELEKFPSRMMKKHKNATMD